MLDLISQVFNANQAFFGSVLGVFYKIPGIPNAASVISNEVMTVLNHIFIGPDDCSARWNIFHLVRVKRIVEVCRQRNCFIRIVVSKEQCQSDLRIMLLCFSERLSYKTIKAAVISNDKVIYTVKHNMSFYYTFQEWHH